MPDLRAKPPLPGQLPSSSSSPIQLLPAEGVLDALKMILVGAPLSEVLTSLIRLIESQSSGMKCTIFLADSDGTHLWYGAAPSISKEYQRATDGLRVGPDCGSCGAAAYTRQPVFVADVLIDPKWSKLRDSAVAAGLRAAWSSPILSSDGKLLGTFGVYYGEVRTPDRRDIHLIESASHIAGIAIERERSSAALLAAFEDIKRSEGQLRQIVDSIPQAIVMLSADGSIEYANRFALDYMGLSAELVMDRDFRPEVFHSEDLEGLAETRRNAFSRGIAWENELRVRRRDGQYRWFLIRYNPLLDAAGHLIRWCAAGTDIDERRGREERLRKENLALREEIDHSAMYEEIVGSSEPLRKVLALVGKVAPTDSTVLILGETGTGKELIARAIHRRSNRAARAFIRVNCAAIPASLMASELFGHEKGAFTGAIQRRVGRFESADGGTIFLDEIGELPLEMQTALLRVLQDREFERVGSSRPISVDVRVLAATNRDLEAAVAAGTFRQDLFFRLNVFPLHIPALRQRKDDIPLLLEYLMERYAKRAGKKITHVAKRTLELFQQYDWPGNIRELQNVVERSVILSEDNVFFVDETWLRRTQPQRGDRFSSWGSRLAQDQREFTDREKEAIKSALAECDGRIAGPRGAAARLGIPRQTLDSKIASLGIDKDEFKRRSRHVVSPK